MNTHSSLVDLFLHRWQALGGSCESHPNAVAAELGLLVYLNDHPGQRLLSWHPEQLPIPNLQATLSDAGYELIPPERRNLDPNFSLGLTSADAAVARTGSLILAPGPGRSWLPALIPIRHAILLPTSRLHADLATWRAAWQAAGRGQDLGHSLIVSGPSFSDDIELHHHRGMFGPRYLHLFLFED